MVMNDLNDGFHGVERKRLGLSWEEYWQYLAMRRLGSEEEQVQYILSLLRMGGPENVLRAETLERLLHLERQLSRSELLKMTDAEFLDYCDSQIKTERAAFIPEHLATLYRLAGETTTARAFDLVAASLAHSQPSRLRFMAGGVIIDANPDLRAEIFRLIEAARERLR